MEENNNKKPLFGFLKKLKIKNIKTIIVCVLFVVILIIFASSFQTKKSTKTTNTTQSSLSALEYCKEQENRLEYVLKSVKGISNVKVFVMVSESPEIVYLENQTTSGDLSKNTTTSSAVFVKNGTITQPVVKIEKLPKIIGVLVIAKGAGDLKMKTTLTNIISSVLGTNISNVEVLEGR